MVKKVFLMGVTAAMLSSCSSLLETARTEGVASNITSVTVADLDVYPERVEASIPKVTSELRRGGEENVKRAVEAKALKENGRGDLLVEPQYVMEKKRGLLSTRITSISVSGRPASFKNFRSLNDSVWTNPVFRGVDNRKHHHASASASASAQKGKSSSSNEEEASVKVKPVWRPTGFKSILEFDGFGVAGQDGGGFDVLYTLGYQFNRHFFVGIGAGYSHSEGEDFMIHSNSSHDREDMKLRNVPLFAQARWYMTRTQVSPFLDMRLGAYVSCYNSYDDGRIYHIKDKNFSGIFVHPTLGVAISTKKGKTVSLGFFYDLRGIREDRDGHDGFYREVGHRIGGTLGFTF